MTVGQKIYCDENMCKICGNKERKVFNIQDETGEGMITCFHVFHGIDLIFNDFHMQSCISHVKPKENMLRFDHCNEGRIEWECDNDTYLYLQQGDMQITTQERHERRFEFPTNHYHGITIVICMEEAKQTLAQLIGGIPVDLYTIKEKFSNQSKPYIMRESDQIKHIFAEMYHVPKRICLPYFRIKIIELLLFLSVLQVPQSNEKRPYFSKSHVETTKAIRRLITQDLENHYTIEELSEQFSISKTSLKNCFKAVYGTSIYTYLRTFRMQTAAFMLSKTNQSITEIAANVGYSNPSKFSSAFNKIMGKLPIEYRKTIV